MGMDVMGKNATSERGSYFRNNVWYWRPLWDYCIHVGENIIDDHLAEHGHYNDGEGLDAEGSARLAEVLRTELANGGTAKWAKNQAEWRASLPREACNLCDCTGIRTDEVGVKSGMPERELSPEVQILTGRTHGWCNACEGVGTTENWMAHYPFSEENVREFADFLAECGGFEIW